MVGDARGHAAATGSSRGLHTDHGRRRKPARVGARAPEQREIRVVTMGDVWSASDKGDVSGSALRELGALLPGTHRPPEGLFLLFPRVPGRSAGGFCSFQHPQAEQTPLGATQGVCAASPKLAYGTDTTSHPGSGTFTTPGGTCRDPHGSRGDSGRGRAFVADFTGSWHLEGRATSQMTMSNDDPSLQTSARKMRLILN